MKHDWIKARVAEGPTRADREARTLAIRERRHRAYVRMRQRQKQERKDPVKIARDVQQTIPITESIARLDAQFPWLRGAERTH